jgi:hypothetical protein
MIDIRFSGWFQCRLATDPDPYDEPRGVSGYVHAYVGEPDLDRRIVFQRPSFTRQHAPRIGVLVDQVSRDHVPDTGHPLLGAAVDLLDSPCFEGRNGVIADDGFEPVYPFRIEITKDPFRMVRGIAPQNPDYPFPELFAQGVEPAPDEIREATGIQDLAYLWQERVNKLRARRKGAAEKERTGLAERVAFLERQLKAGGGAARFFLARMRYEYNLAASPTVSEPDDWLPEASLAASTPWPIRFWFGAWDADVLCAFARGTITIGAPSSHTTPPVREQKVTDRRP